MEFFLKMIPKDQVGSLTISYDHSLNLSEQKISTGLKEIEGRKLFQLCPFNTNDDQGTPRITMILDHF